MEDNIDESSSESKNDYKKLAKNSFFSYINNYMAFFFTIFNSFIIARLISINDWGLLLIAISYITIVSIILNFLPPGLDYSLNHYIPEYLALGQGYKVKTMIKHALILKIVILIPVFLISIIIFTIFLNLFKINLNEQYHLIFILSPLIIVNSLEFIILSIDRGLSKFRLISLFFLIRKCAYTGILIYLFLFFKTSDVQFIAYINMFSNTIPFIGLLAINYLIYRKMETKKNEPISFKDSFHKTLKYGSSMGFAFLIAQLWKEAKIQGIGYFKTPSEVTGYNIGIHLQDVGVFSFRSLHFPLVTSFASFYAKDDLEKVSLTFKIALKGSLFILLLISGIIFFVNEFILYFFFTESYLVFQITVRLLMISLIFRVMTSLVESLLNVEHKVKYILYFELCSLIYYIPLFFIPLMLFGLYPAILFGLILGNIISLVLLIIIAIKIGGINLNIKNIVLQYFTFFISLGLTIILFIFVLDNVNRMLFSEGIFAIFYYLHLPSTLIFIISYLLINLVFKTISKTEISLFESFFSGEGFLDKTLRKIMNSLKVFTRK